ncbi:MAG: DUF429 domain-containing protein [Cyclobacteriaceae bacterium]|nr:DUF429 domain-containing protein [Cyclobacteriaceae bacterium]MCH8517001.1 DUF429 domain-containing protein [Cyclobacteriaceae bacterium]
MSITIAGVDYGSKLAGTTVLAVCTTQDRQVSVYSSKKKQDADRMLVDLSKSLMPDRIYLDAPLSLPGVYRDLEGYSDYFYRKCDQELSAMSVMFLGGLTARAMKLSKELNTRGIDVKEVYPGHLARMWSLQELSYKKELSALPNCLSFLIDQTRLNIDPSLITNWHEFDALLALSSGLRDWQGEAKVYGKPEEGLIRV